MAEDYSQQLLTDGATTMIGYISIEKNGQSYTVHITEKEVVPSSDYDEGYYIADTNVSKDATFGSDARIACTHDGKYQVETADEFIEKSSDHSKQLYTLYLMGDSVELILSTVPEDVEISQ